jgi:7-carboxy-7-deazaguanine synthase
MAYSVKEMFYTLQGEGFNAGRPAVFCRFSGCNLWSGREQDRSSAVCQFCDTDFVGTDGLGGGKFASATELVDAVVQFWPQRFSGKRLVVCTGGEPLLQMDQALISEFHSREIEIAVETNGTVDAPEGLDWICVSPKSGSLLVLSKGNELKVVYPQSVDPRTYENLKFDHFFVQAMDGPNQTENLAKSIEFCLENPRWRLSLQTHKLLGLR